MSEDTEGYISCITDSNLVEIINDLHRKRNTGNQIEKSELVINFKKSNYTNILYFEEDIYSEALIGIIKELNKMTYGEKYD